MTERSSTKLYDPCGYNSENPTSFLCDVLETPRKAHFRRSDRLHTTATACAPLENSRWASCAPGINQSTVG